MNVLAIQLKRIGDLVLTTPALHAMRAAGAHVTLALTDGTAALLPALGESVDDTLLYRTRGGANANYPVWKQVTRTSFDACVDFTGSDRSALMTLASRAPRRVTARQSLRRGRWRSWVYSDIADSSVRSRHTVDHYLDHLAALGMPVVFSEAAPAAPLLNIPAEQTELVGKQLPQPFVVIHPGSARSEKYWVPERWAEVIRFLQRERGLRCILTGGSGDPTEDEHLARILAALGPDAEFGLNWVGRQTLLSLAALLSKAALVVSVDTGPMHLAAAFRRPQIALFGPTNPFHWRPRHPGTLILQSGHGDAPVREFDQESPGGPMDAISTQAVINCIRQVPL